MHTLELHMCFLDRTQEHIGEDGDVAYWGRLCLSSWLKSQHRERKETRKECKTWEAMAKIEI